MANEIQMVTKLSWTRDGAQAVMNITEQINQVGVLAIQNAQTVGATSETVLLGDVVPKYIMFKNGNSKWSSLTQEEKDATGYATEALYNAANLVHVGNTNPATAGTASASLAPQQGSSYVGGQTAWYAIGVTEPVTLLTLAIEA